MNNRFRQRILVMVAGVAWLSLFVTTASAGSLPPPSLEPLPPVPVVVLPAEPDFSDAEFANADQADLGRTTGGNIVVVGGGGHHGNGHGHGHYRGGWGGGEVFVGGGVSVVVLVLLLLLLL